MKKLRAIYRSTLLVGYLPFMGAMAMFQSTIVGPLTHNKTRVPNMLYGGLRGIFGYKIVLNKASAPLVKDKPVWFLANHISSMDFIPAGVALNGAFVGKSDILKSPGIAPIARALKFIGIERNSSFNAQSRGKIAKNFNAGRNTIMFPEATTSDGSEVKLFRAGLLTLLFNGAAVDKKNRPVKLEKDVVVQPIAIRVKSVNGKEVANDASLRELYCMSDAKSELSHIWKSLHIKNITLEITAFPPLDPKDFKSAEDLANAAALSVASVINPGQTTFEKAVIPMTSQPQKPQKNKTKKPPKNPPKAA